MSIKPNLKCSKFAQYKAEYKEKLAIVEANIDTTVAACNKVTAIYETLSNEKNELVFALRSGGSVVQEIVDKTNRIENMKSEVQKLFDKTMGRIRGEKNAIAPLESQCGKIKQEESWLRCEVVSLESNLATPEDDKMTKANQTRALKEGIVHQKDRISTLQKKKRRIGESRQKTEEDIQAMEDKLKIS